MSTGVGAVLYQNVNFLGGYTIGNYSIIGDAGDSPPLTIGDGIKVGSFCRLYSGSDLGYNVEIDDYCAIYSSTIIGNHVKLLYGKKIYSRAVIGNNCIIGGNIPERMVLADKVTFMGEVAHSHYNPNNDWDTTDEPSPEVGEGSVIGVNALLIGGIKVGCDCYVSAGEILRHDLPDHSVFFKNNVYNINKFKGLIQTRFNG